MLTASPLRIVRGRTWTLVQTLLDNQNGPESDMTGYTNVRQQIRKFTGELVANATVVLVDATLTSSLTRAGTSNLVAGVYETDILATDPNGNDEVLMEPEGIEVTNDPTSPTGGDVVPADVPLVIPDFVQIAEDALED